ncbi:unnamed protein product, partial [Tilletia controversa]
MEGNSRSPSPSHHVHGTTSISPRVSVSRSQLEYLKQSAEDARGLRQEVTGLRQELMSLRQLQTGQPSPLSALPSRVPPHVTGEGDHVEALRPRPGLTTISSSAGSSSSAPSQLRASTNSGFRAAQLLRNIGASGRSASSLSSAASSLGFASATNQRQGSFNRIKLKNDSVLMLMLPTFYGSTNAQIYYVPWSGAISQRVATPNLHMVLGRWDCVATSPNLTADSSADDVWNFVRRSFPRFAKDIETLGFTWCSASPPALRLWQERDKDGAPLFPTGADLAAIYSGKQAYVVGNRDEPPAAPPSSYLPPLEVMFDRSRWEGGGSAAASGSRPGKETGKNQCEHCRVRMPPHVLAQHTCVRSDYKVKHEPGSVKQEPGLSGEMNNTIDDAISISSGESD